MIGWLLELIGVDPTLAGRVAEAQWLWARPGLLWLGLVLLLPAAVFVFRRHRRSLPHLTRGQRGVLTFCRVGVLALLVFVLGAPYLRLEESVTQKPVVAVMVDGSGSMALPTGGYEGEQLRGVALAAGVTELADEASEGEDGERLPAVDAEGRRTMSNMSRAALLERVWEQSGEAMFTSLAERFEVRGYRFDRRGQAMSLSGLASVAEDAAAMGTQTAIGAALQEVIEDVGGRAVAGIVLFSDGQSNAGPGPADVVRRWRETGAGTASATAGEDEAAAVRVWTVPVGSGARLVDVRLMDVLAPARVARGDTASIVATVASHGFDGRAVRVRLLEGENVLDDREVTLTDDDRQQVNLRFTAAADDEPGTRLLRVEVESLSEEQVADNNEQSLAVDVDETQWEVLYLEGYPRWDFRFLDHALQRDRGLAVRMVMEAPLRAGEGVDLAELPALARLPEDAAGWAEYHVVVLGDVSTDLLPERAQAQLARAVREEGLGLIVQAGPQHMPHAFADGPLAELLPVELSEGDAGDEQGGWEAEAYSPFKMQVTATGATHPALRLYDQAARNRGVWSQMPPFYWAAALGEPRPGATVLAELASAEHEGVPLVAEHYAGSGRVMLIGLDSTYRWRRNIGDHLFYRFWGQALRHVARTTERDGQTSWLAAYPPRVEPGERVSVELYAVDGDGQPATREQATLQVRHGEQTDTLELHRTPTPGIYRGQWSQEAHGQYTLTHTDAAGEELTANVRVASSSRELLRPDVDRETLGTLAEATGGELIELDELPRLADAFEGEPATLSQVHVQELWDNWLTLLLLVSLYCTDVFVRRMAGVM
ncbi:MAG: hypothetical protein WD534_07485 [Phycisphaeraceae bacterium]